MSDESDRMVVVYEASSVAEAQMLSDRLSAADINHDVANVDSPFDGLTAAYQTISVRVLADDAEAAARIVEQFLGEHAD